MCELHNHENYQPLTPGSYRPYGRVECPAGSHRTVSLIHVQYFNVGGGIDPELLKTEIGWHHDLVLIPKFHKQFELDRHHVNYCCGVCTEVPVIHPIHLATFKKFHMIVLQ